MNEWFPAPIRLRTVPCWIARFECGHHGTFQYRPAFEYGLRYGCPHCGWKYITALCRVPEPG